MPHQGGRDENKLHGGRRRFLKTVGVGSAAAMAGVGLVGNAAAQEETIRLGGSMSLSGDNADLGELYRDSYELAIQRINDEGGFERDGTTYTLEMVIRDDQTDASRSRSIYQELIDQEGIDYLLGPYASSVTLPASAVAAQTGRPMVEGGGASPEIFSQGNEWIFGLLPTADLYSLSGIDMALNQDEPPETVALLAEDDTFSQSTLEGAVEAIEQTDLEIVVNETFPTEASDLSTNLGKVRDQEADMLILAAHQKHAVILASQMESQNVNPDMAMATVGSLTASFKEETGANGNYIYGPSSWANDAEYDGYLFGTAGDYTEAHQEAFDYEPDYHNAAGVAVVETFHQAFQQASELSPEAVRDAIRDIQFTSAYGEISFQDNGVIDKDMLTYQWQPGDGDAEKVIVWPENVQQSEPIYPMPTWDER
jgi:branched-chain amino acid transport system substrate-binding protein